jgi:molecular chaperone GrpE
MSMADSLIERAKEATTAGALDDKYVAELETEIKQLQDLSKSAQQSADAYEKTLTDFKDKFVRLQADFENFRKRSATEKTNLATSVRGDVVSELLPLIDNFELAGKQLVLETDGEKKVDAAYQGLYKQMVEIFRNLGLEATPGAGEPFDPNIHEAIMREPNEDVPDGTVLEEFRKGFVLGEKLLRPAMVKVSFSDVPAAAAASTEEDKVAAGADSE